MVVVALCWLQLGGPKGSWGCDGMCPKSNYLRIHHLKPREKTLDISWLEGCILSSWSLAWWYLWVHGMSLQGMILRGCLQKTGEPRKFSLKQQNVPRKSGYSHRFKPRISKFTWELHDPLYNINPFNDAQENSQHSWCTCRISCVTPWAISIL